MSSRRVYNPRERQLSSNENTQSQNQSKDIKNNEELQKPVYGFSKDQNGELKVDSMLEPKEKNINVELRVKVINEMLINLEKEIEKAKIEIEIHEILGKELATDVDRSINSNRIENYSKNIEYLIKKKIILETKIKTNS